MRTLELDPKESVILAVAMRLGFAQVGVRIGSATDKEMRRQLGELCRAEHLNTIEHLSDKMTAMLAAQTFDERTARNENGESGS